MSEPTQSLWRELRDMEQRHEAWPLHIRKRICELEQDLEAYHRLQKGCSTCATDKNKRAMIDTDGVLCSVSGKPGQWGHALDDSHWYCSIDGAVAECEQLRMFVVCMAEDLIAHGDCYCNRDDESGLPKVKRRCAVCIAEEAMSFIKGEDLG